MQYDADSSVGASMRGTINDLEFSSEYSSSNAKWARRIKTLPALFGAFFLTWTLLPALVLATAVRDAICDRRFPTTRLVCFGAWWLAMECAGVFVSFLLWLRFAPRHQLGGIRSRRAHSSLQKFWAMSLTTGARFIIGLRWSTDGVSCLAPSGPLLVLARHGSQGDAVLTAALLAGQGRRLRFVLKKELLLDPCLDIVGHRIPNYFVNRDSLNNLGELRNIGLLASNLQDDEALVIFPEGTRFSPEKLTRAITAIADTAPHRLAAVKSLKSVLPIRTAGTLAALSTASDADIVFCNHVGITDISSLKQLHKEVPIEKPLQFTFERTPRANLSRNWDETELVYWLDKQWAKIDVWVTSVDAPKSPHTRN